MGALALAAAALAVTPTDAPGAFEFSWPTARAAGLGGAGVDLATGPPAAVLPEPDGGSEGPGAADATAPPDSASRAAGPALQRIELSGGELYGLPEARGFLARATVGSGLGSASLTVGQLGGGLYRERAIGVALARPLRRTLVAEVGWRLLSVGARGVPERTAAAVDAALASRVLGRIVIAARWRNVGDARIGESPVSAGASLGASLVLDGVSLAGSLELDPRLGTAVAVGCEATVSEWLRVRAGVALDPGAFGAGIGMGREPRGRGGVAAKVSADLLTWPVVDLAVTWHPDLGGSSFATITFFR